MSKQSGAWFHGIQVGKTGMKIHENEWWMIDMEQQGWYMIETFIQLWSIKTIECNNEKNMYSDSYEKLEKCYESVKVC